MLETEIKLPIPKEEPIEAKLLACGFASGASVREEDTYFAPSGNVPTEAGFALRIRQVTDLATGNRQSLITYKGQRQSEDAMVRRELETGLGDANTMREILLALGYQPLPVRVKKERHVLTRGPVNACVDAVAGLGRFLELEIILPDGAAPQEALATIDAILASLGHGREETVTTSYLKQLLAK